MALSVCAGAQKPPGPKQHPLNIYQEWNWISSSSTKWLNNEHPNENFTRGSVQLKTSPSCPSCPIIKPTHEQRSIFCFNSCQIPLPPTSILQLCHCQHLNGLRKHPGVHRKSYSHFNATSTRNKQPPKKLSQF